MKRLLPLLLLLAASAALAEAFPTKTVRIVVPFPAGGAVDASARLLAPKLAEAWKQPVIVENRAGAGGFIGMASVAKGEADGHTILLSPISVAIGPALYKKLAFDPEKELTPVTQVVGTTLVLLANAKVPANNLKELVALAKSKPGALNYGSVGVADPLQLTMELLKLQSGIDIVPIVYKGQAQVATALLAGEVDVAVQSLSISLGHIKAGRLRPLGVADPKRSAAAPDVPTIAEGGFPGFELTSWQGMFVQAATPREIVAAIQREVARAVNSPEIRERLIGSGQEPVGGSTADFEARFKSDLAKFVMIVRDARIPFQD